MTRVVHTTAQTRGSLEVAQLYLHHGDTMPSLKRMPSLVLSDTRSRTYGAKGKASKARRSLLAGKRTGYVHPTPSAVPTGSLETKVLRFSNREIEPTYQGQVIHINQGITQGTSSFTRLGHKIRNTGNRIKGHFYADFQGPRVAIVGYSWVWDKSPNKALPAVADIFTIDATKGFDMANTLLVDDNSDRFKVLRSVRKVISKTQGTGVNTDFGNEKNLILIDDFLKLPASCVTTYVKGNATGGIGNVLTGALYLIPFVKNVSLDGATNVKFAFTQESYFAEA